MAIPGELEPQNSGLTSTLSTPEPSRPQEVITSDGIANIPQLKFEVISTRVSQEKAKKYVAYMVQVRWTSDEADPYPAKIERRYNEFLELYNSLKREFPDILSNLQFPKKTLMGNFTPEIISARRSSFEEFLNLIASEKQLKDCPAFSTFLQKKEIIESLRLIQDKEFDQARVLVENSFRLINKIQTDRSPMVLQYLCLLVSLYAESVDYSRALNLAALAVRRYQGVSDIDLLRYYVPLLHTTLDLCREAGKDTQNIAAHLTELKRKGFNVNSSTPLFELVLSDLYPMLEVYMV